MNLREVGEDQLLQKIARICRSIALLVSGVGDDCAVTEFPGRDQLLVLKTDCIVQESISRRTRKQPTSGGKRWHDR